MGQKTFYHLNVIKFFQGKSISTFTRVKLRKLSHKVRMERSKNENRKFFKIILSNRKKQQNWTLMLEKTNKTDKTPGYIHQEEEKNERTNHQLTISGMKGYSQQRLYTCIKG